MESTIQKFKIWSRSSWPYWLYIKAMFALQPYRDDTFEATQIIENLWVGDNRSPCNKESLKDHGIDLIVSAVHGATAYHPFEFDYENADLRDLSDEDILTEIDAILPEIRKAIRDGKGVLVHCMQGASRSASIVAAYLIRYHNMRAEEALSYMKRKRSCVNPNEGYRKQLDHYEQMVRDENENYGMEKKEN